MFKLRLLAAPQSDSPEEEELRLTLNSLSTELHKLDDIHWICPLMQCSEEVGGDPGALRPALRGGGSELFVCFRSRCGAAARAAA